MSQPFDGDELDDLAAEPDTTEPVAASDPAGEAAGPDQVYSGPCHDGPWDGQRGQSRFPSGFLLIDKPNRLCWVYDRNPSDGGFYARTTDPQPLQEEGRWRAAEESTYDIRVVAA
jgi:hypothetical protein